MESKTKAAMRRRQGIGVLLTLIQTGLLAMLIWQITLTTLNGLFRFRVV